MIASGFEVDWRVDPAQRKQEAIRVVGKTVNRGVQAFMDSVSYRDFITNGLKFRVPSSGYFFNYNDCWARIEGARARVGVSDYVRLLPGDVLSFDLPDEGTEVAIFEEICSVPTTGLSIDVRSPVTGKIVCANKDLVETPGLLKEDPYERGWLVEVELDCLEDDIELLMSAEQYFDIAKAKIAGGPRGCPCSRRGVAQKT